MELAHLLVESLLDKKGKDIILLDLHEQAVFADYFLICSGDSDRQIRALAGAVMDDAKEKAGVLIRGREGYAETGWMLIDFGNLIVHIFSNEKRAFYDLESLWSNAHTVLRMQ